MTVLVFGSLNIDLVAYARNLPALGETVKGEKLLRFPGGKGLNQAIAAKRSGSAVLMVGVLGSDSEGNYLNQILMFEKIDTRFVSTVNKPTGLAIIEVSADGKNRILMIPGANTDVKFSDRHLTTPCLPKVCLAQLETPIEEVTKFISEAKNAGSITILNPTPAQSLPEKVITSCDFLIVNESEASYLIGNSKSILNQKEASEIGKILNSKGANSVIVTLGNKGSLYVDKNKEIFTPAFKVKAIDTTAAGDAFCGAFASALSQEKPITECLRFASAAGALAVTQLGAVPSLPNSEDILSLLASVQ